LRWLGAIVLSALVIVGLLTLLGQGPAVPGLGLGQTPSTETPASGYAAQDARLVQTDARGVPLYLLQAEFMSKSADSDDLAALIVQLNYVPPEDPKAARPWKLTAREGRLVGGSPLIKLSGNVRLTGNPPSSTAPLRIETGALDFDLDQQIARTRLPVNFYWGTRRLSARGLNADLKRGTLRLESSVHGRIPP
jgi:LPS export ABC transporter protein LptC